MKNYQLADGQTWFEGQWLSGDTPLISGMSSGSWVASTVFDGLRSIGGYMPDVDLHVQRLIKSSESLGHTPPVTWQEVLRLCWEGVTRFPEGSDLYLRPMIWADTGFIIPDPESARFALTIFPMKMPKADDTMTAMITDLARPLPHTAPTMAKAAALYPNSGLAIKQARENGFANGILLDVFGNIAEFSASNLFMVKNGEVITPVDNKSFLCGITRLRALSLLKELGIPHREGVVTREMLYDADEVISTGNYAKIMAVSKVDHVEYAIGPVFRKLLAAYQDYTHAYGGKSFVSERLTATA